MQNSVHPKKLRTSDHSQLKYFMGMIADFHKCGKKLYTVWYQLKQSYSFYRGNREQAAYGKALPLLFPTVLPTP